MKFVGVCEMYNVCVRNIISEFNFITLGTFRFKKYSSILYAETLYITRQ